MSRVTQPVADERRSFADLWETVADTLPEAQAIVHSHVRRSWADLHPRADGIAAWLLGLGVSKQDKVAPGHHRHARG